MDSVIKYIRFMYHTYYSVNLTKYFLFFASFLLCIRIMQTITFLTGLWKRLLELTGISMSCSTFLSLPCYGRGQATSSG